MEKALRKECNRQSAALLIYKMIMSTSVTVVMLVGVMAALIGQMLNGVSDPDHLLQIFFENLMIYAGSGWGYLVAILIGLIALLMWKKPRFFHGEILKKGRPMRVSSFFVIISLFMGAQLASQLGLLVMDLIFGFFGKSVSAYLESAGIDSGSFSMWLYAGLGAPIFEEILFRGLLMRSLEPYGKRMSILVSALLFGFYHGNPVQAPYAALVGMVLGYVAMEYNIIWAMVLHMFNNLIFADAIPRLLQGFPMDVQNVIVYAFMAVFAVAAAVLLIIKRRQVREAIRKDPIMSWQYNGAFLSPLLLILIGSCVVDMVLFVGMILIS